MSEYAISDINTWPISTDAFTDWTLPHLLGHCLSPLPDGISSQPLSLLITAVTVPVVIHRLLLINISLISRTIYWYSINMNPWSPPHKCADLYFTIIILIILCREINFTFPVKRLQAENSKHSILLYKQTHSRLILETYQIFLEPVEATSVFLNTV